VSIKAHFRQLLDRHIATHQWMMSLAVDAYACMPTRWRRDVRYGKFWSSMAIRNAPAAATLQYRTRAFFRAIFLARDSLPPKAGLHDLTNPLVLFSVVQLDY
jgi:hypothetical protein